MSATLMFLNLGQPVTSTSIPLNWTIPEGAGLYMRLDWKLDDSIDNNWPTDHAAGGELDFADNVHQHNFIPIPGQAYAFRTRRTDNGHTSRILKVTAPTQ